ncbi:MAG: hypothetical protein ACYDEC_12070 [Bacteroidia bacterium]
MGYQEALKEYKHNVTVYKDFLKLTGKKTVNLGALLAAPALPVFSSTVTPDIFGRVAKLITTIKNHDGYTENIGKDLGIIGADPYPTPRGGSTLSTQRTSVLKPLLKIKFSKGGRPWLRWKKGHTHAIRIEVDRNDGKGFVLLIVGTHNSYVDKFQLPLIDTSIIWKYRAIYLDKYEEEEGEWSEIAKVTVTGV